MDLLPSHSEGIAASLRAASRPRDRSLLARSSAGSLAGGAALAAVLFLAFCASPAFPGEDNAAAPQGPPVAQETNVPEPAPEGAVVGEVRVRPENIFDIEDPRENNWLFRLANHLHYRTRPYVIREQLLFRSGERYDPRLLEESERILRTNRYLYDARVRPTAFHDNQVDVEVVTRDVWTLSPGFSFKREGGSNTTSFDVEESNLFGRGSMIHVSRDSTPERDIEAVKFVDEHLFGSWFRTEIVFEQNSDGRKRVWQLDRPFRTLDSRWAAGGTYTDDERIDTLVGSGPTAGSYVVKAKTLRAYGGWSPGLSGGRVWRFLLGWVRDESRFSPPPEGTAGLPLPADRVLYYPFAGFERVEDQFDKLKNREQIERTEDFYLGLTLRANLGYATPAFGSDRQAFPVSAAVGNGWKTKNDRWIVLFEGAADGRFERGSVRDTTLTGGTRAYLDFSRHWVLFGSLSGARMVDPDDDHQVTLGGDSGLRGYPIHYQAGDRKFVGTLEQRYFSDWYPFRLFRIGGAVFFDAGRAWGGKRGGLPAPGVLRDAGVGLRVAVTRSGLGNVVHVDLAFPFDGDPSIARAQVHVVTKQSF